MASDRNSTHEFLKSSKKDLLMEVKDYMNNDPRRFFNFRKDNEAEKGSQGMIPAQGHCFSTFLMAWLKNTTSPFVSIKLHYVVAHWTLLRNTYSVRATV